MEQKRLQSSFMLISSMVIFGTIGIFRRYIPLPSGVLALSRGILGALFLLVFVTLTHKKSKTFIGTKKLALLVLSGCLMGFNWILLFEAYNETTVATATLCYYMEPTIVILLSPVFFREKLTIKKLLCAGAAVVGMILVSGVMNHTQGEPYSVKGIFLGLGAAVLYSAVVILNKKIPMEDAYRKSMIQLFSAGMIMLPYILITGEYSNIKLNWFVVGMILVVGIVHTGIAYTLYFGSMKNISAQSIAVLSYIDPVSALLLSAIVLREKLTVYGIIGAVLIIGSAIYSEKTSDNRNQSNRG